MFLAFSAIFPRVCSISFHEQPNSLSISLHLSSEDVVGDRNWYVQICTFRWKKIIIQHFRKIEPSGKNTIGSKNALVR
jgi:hypothetical protein